MMRVMKKKLAVGACAALALGAKEAQAFNMIRAHSAMAA